MGGALTVYVSAEASGSVVVREGGMTVHYPYSFSYCATVELEAVPASGHRFVGWSGHLSGDENPASLTINGLMTVTARFVPVRAFTASTGSSLEIGALEGTITELRALEPAGTTVTDGAPEDLRYGLIEMDMEVGSPGGQAVIVIYLDEPAPQNYRFFKYDDSRGWFDFSRDVISEGTGDGVDFNDDRTVATIYITDNGDYDRNSAEREIGDPLGFGISASDVSPSSGEDEGGGCFIGAVWPERKAPR